jgi:hypothetical protein
VAARQTSIKKYVVKLSDEERAQLTASSQKGSHPSRQVLKVRILLKADASDSGDGWSDGRIAAALDTSVDTVARIRQLLVYEAALKHKHLPASARLIALACQRGGPDGRWNCWKKPWWN